MKTTKPILAALALVSTSLITGCGVGEASVEDAAAIQAATPVTAKISGEIVELVAEEGEWVKAGQILARLDGERVRLEVLSAKANLERAKKEYKRNAGLHKRGLISASMFEGMRYDLAALEASYGNPPFFN